MGILSNIKRDIKSAGANKGKFIYFREGQKLRIRFLQDLEDALEVVFHDNWEERKNYPCQKAYGKPCKYCGDDTLRTRCFYVWSVYNYEENDVQLFMFAVNNCSPVPALAGMYEEYGTLTDRDYIISVTGKQTAKTYSVVPSDKNKFRNQKVKPYSKQKVLEMISKAYPLDDDLNEEDQEQSWVEGKYDGKTARELYDMCKDRSISVVPRKPTQYYIKSLEEYDRKQEEWADAEEDQSDYDDEWVGVDNDDDCDSVEDNFMNIPENVGDELPFN